MGRLVFSDVGGGIAVRSGGLDGLEHGRLPRGGLRGNRNRISRNGWC